MVIRGFKDRNFYDFSETYAPVSRLPLVRAVFSIINKYDLDVTQLDVKTAFLNGILEDEIYMEIPDGEEVDVMDRQNMICKLKKALYGLKVSLKRWNVKFTEVALKIGLVNDREEPCLFLWREGDKFVILLLYVDDIILAGNDKEKMEEIEKCLMMEFKMKDLEEPQEFLGIEIRRDKESKTIALTQKKYIDRILMRFGIDDDKIHKQSTPMVTRQVANRRRCEESDDERNDERWVTNVPYREAVGSLLYLAGSTRPDIAYAVNVLSRQQSNPTSPDWKMVIRVFWYLKETKDGLEVSCKKRRYAGLFGCQFHRLRRGKINGRICN